MKLDNQNKKRKKFIKLPQFPGGKTALNEFISAHLVYPQEAVENKIEGSVHLFYEVTYSGDVVNIKVLNGIGYGCDDEAVRVVSLLKYGTVNNPGMRVIAKKRIRIDFKFNPQEFEILYNYVPKLDNNKPSENVYGYTISFG